MRRRHGHVEPDPFERIRQAIVAIENQRRAAESNAGRALANQAEVDGALGDQLRDLAEARTQITAALTAATRAGDDVRAGGDAHAAVAYDQTARSLRSALEVLGASSDQVAALREASQTNLHQARGLLASARRTLDAAMRDQVRLLRTAERAHRERVAERVRQAQRRT